MKRTIIAASVLALGLAGTGVSFANPGEGNGGGPGPNGNNTFGLCTAYGSGSEKGQEKKQQAPPFQALEAAAEAKDMTVEEYCEAFGGHPGGGNPNGG